MTLYLLNLKQNKDAIMIRITGGKHRSRLLETPNTGLTKPTMDKVRAAVFNALTGDIENKKILDLFSGSGSYGFEALSRGALSVTFIDKQAEAINVIKKNASNLKETNIRIIKDDVLSALESLDEQFDLIFVDPPYKLDIYQDVLYLLNKNNLLSEHAIIVLEAEKELDIDFSTYTKTKLYNYGLAKIYIVRK